MMILIQNKVVSDSKMMKLLCVFIVSHVLIASYSHLSRPVGRGGSRGSLEPPFWPPKDFIYTAIVHFKCPTGPLVGSLLLRITAVQASLVAAMRVCS